MWYEKQIEKVDQGIVNWSKKKIKKYKINQLKYLIQILENQSHTCDACEMYKSTIERMIRHMGDEGSYTEYAHLMKLIRQHLMKDHDYVPKYQQLIVISLLVFSFGAVIGSFVFSTWMIIGIIGSIMGVLIGILMNMNDLSSELKM